MVRCNACGFLYQNPRVREDRLSDCYPNHYPRHQEPSPRSPLRGSRARQRAVRWALARHLGYRHLWDSKIAAPGWITSVQARSLLRRLSWECPPFVGAGRLLDAGCGSGAFLGLASALGWRCAGIEMDSEAASKARRFTPEIFSGNILDAPFEPRRFDLVTAFHVLEHLPDPLAVLRRMLDWLAPGGLAVVEVPNAGGLGAALFGGAWSGLELPRHISHFTPESLRRLVELAGGRVLWCRHHAKPRWYLWSLGHWLKDRKLDGLARAATWRPVYGFLKLFLEATLPLVRAAGRGEVIRMGITPTRSD